MTSAAVPTPPGILRDETERTFDAPWQAQAFALVVQLNKAGRFSWDERRVIQMPRWPPCKG